MTDKTALSPRQAEIARLAAAGLTCRAIAERLSMAPNTVKYHHKRVYRVLGIHDRAQLANSLHGYKDHPNG